MNSDIAPSPSDLRFLNAALRLARKHQGLTGTNPSVACVIVKDLGHGPVIVGSAVTARGGRPHAEPPSLEEAGENARGATAYVTLEPCAHHGKTPPCAQTLIDAGISRVVTAIVDPDNRVNGKGHEMLLNAGVEVSELDGGEPAARVIQGYLKARSGVMPFVTLKLAMDENGLVGCQEKGNVKISGQASKLQTHLTRARHDAILIGSGTALADDPSLTCRLPGMEDRSPVRVVLDRRFQITAKYEVVKSARSVPTWLVAPYDPPDEWKQMLQDFGLQHIPSEDDDGKIALPELMEDLAARGIQSVMVEGGVKLTQSLLSDDLIDEIIIHVGGNPEKLDEKMKPVFAPFTLNTPPTGFEIVQTLSFGEDTSLRLRKRET